MGGENGRIPRSPGIGSKVLSFQISKIQFEGPFTFAEGFSAFIIEEMQRKLLPLHSS